MRIKWDKHFYFTKTERNGIFILFCLCVLLLLLPKVLPELLSEKETDFGKIKEEIAFLEEVKKGTTTASLPKNTPLFYFNPNLVSRDTFIQLGLSPKVAQTIINYRKAGGRFKKPSDFQKIYGLSSVEYQRLLPYIKLPFKKKTSSAKEKPLAKYVSDTINTPPTPTVPTSLPEKEKKPPLLFRFNPNTISKDSLLALGLPAKVAQTVINYRSRGGEFRKPQDFSKIYGLSNEQFSQLLPYIDIPKPPRLIASAGSPKAAPDSYEENVNLKIDINRASIEDWKKLNGIGDVYAKRLVHFRENLGGFTSVEQIKEVYQVPDSVIEKVAHQLVRSDIPRKIKINAASPSEMKQHPYIKEKQAYIIVNFRVNHGPYKNAEDLKKVKALSPEFISRIEPYLSFEL